MVVNDWKNKIILFLINNTYTCLLVSNFTKVPQKVTRISQKIFLWILSDIIFEVIIFKASNLYRNFE